MYNSFISQEKERKSNHKNVRKTYYWKLIFVICSYSTWSCRHAKYARQVGTWARKYARHVGRKNVSTQDALTPEHVNTQGTLVREHVCTQDTLARERQSTQGTLAGGHVRHVIYTLQCGIVNIRQCKTRQIDFLWIYDFFPKLDCTLNEIQVAVNLSVSVVLLSVLLSHDCRIASRRGPYIYDIHTQGTWGVLEIPHMFVGSTVFKQ